MGMFTKLIHPTLGVIQFKTGDDDMETYRLGDEVRWKADIHQPGCGKLLDGVHEGVLERNTEPPGIEEVMVVIKDHRIVAAERWPGLPLDRAWEAHLWVRYGVEQPAISYWSQEAWAHHAQVHYRARMERRKVCAQLFGVPEDERISKLMTMQTKQFLRQGGFFRSICPPADGQPPKPRPWEEQLYSVDYQVREAEAAGRTVVNHPRSLWGQYAAESRTLLGYYDWVRQRMKAEIYEAREKAGT